MEVGIDEELEVTDITAVVVAILAGVLCVGTALGDDEAVGAKEEMEDGRRRHGWGRREGAKQKYGGAIFRGMFISISKEVELLLRAR